MGFFSNLVKQSQTKRWKVTQVWKVILEGNNSAQILDRRQYSTQTGRSVSSILISLRHSYTGRTSLLPVVKNHNTIQNYRVVSHSSAATKHSFRISFPKSICYHHGRIQELEHRWKSSRLGRSPFSSDRSSSTSKKYLVAFVFTLGCDSCLGTRFPWTVRQPPTKWFGIIWERL